MDKPPGPTSHDAVARVRRLFRLRAVGHAGTLDPFATGLLVLLLGPATRLARFVEAEAKTYLATARLGVTTDSDDRTGAEIASVEPAEWPDGARVSGELGRLQGTALQRPPAYSAKLVGGRRSYRLARRGMPPALQPVEVTVHRIELVDYRPPFVTFRARVSSGTYLRALGRDLGLALGVGAHLDALRREAVGGFRVEAAVPLDRLTGAETLLPPEALVAGMPAVTLARDEIGPVGHGRDVLREGPTSGMAALLQDGRLRAVARAVPGGWHPEIVLPESPQ
ncbi:MAG: tRNA pseudouridine(55) synthase TruB [Gemmatimonadales bacterium]